MPPTRISQRTRQLAEIRRERIAAEKRLKDRKKEDWRNIPQASLFDENFAADHAYSARITPKEGKKAKAENAKNTFKRAAENKVSKPNETVQKLNLAASSSTN